MSDISYILGVFIGLFFINYVPPQTVTIFLSRFYHKYIYLVNHYNHRINEYLKQDKILDQDINTDESENVKPEDKYEDKYLEEIRKLEKEFIFTEDEEALKLQKYLEFFRTSNESHKTKVEEIKDKLNFKEF